MESTYDLDDVSFEVRELAQKELGKLEDLAAPALPKALNGNPSAEVRLRVKVLLSALKEVEPHVTSLRAKRAIEALELSDSAQAVGLLVRLAKESNDAHVKEDAKEGLLLSKRKDLVK